MTVKNTRYGDCRCPLLVISVCPAGDGALPLIYFDGNGAFKVCPWPVAVTFSSLQGYERFEDDIHSFGVLKGEYPPLFPLVPVLAGTFFCFPASPRPPRSPTVLIAVAPLL